MPGMRGQMFQRPIQRAHPPAGDQPERHRRKRRPEFRGADLGGLAAGEFAHQHQRVDVAGLALIGAHARGRVALQMLDRTIILLRGETDVARPTHRSANRRIACPGTPDNWVAASDRPAPAAGAAGTAPPRASAAPSSAA